MKVHIKSFLVSPWTILGSIIAGVLAGVYFPQQSMGFESVGGVYISLLKVVVLPFLLATILVGVISLLQKEGSATMIKRIIVGFVGSMIIAGAIGVGAVALTGSEMTHEKKTQLGALVNNKDQGSDLNITLREPMPVAAPTNPMAVAEKFIPENIFKSLDMGESLKVVIFCLIFGIALGNIKTPGQQILVDVLKSIQQASISIFKFLNYFLPFALLAMISSQVGKVGVGIFGTMLEFICQQALGGAVVILLGTVVIWMKAKTSIMNVINATKETLIVAVSSRSSLACIPYAQEALNKLHFARSGVELTVPLSFTVNRIGSIVYYAIATAFIANIYDMPLGVTGLLVILFGSVLAGLASAGTTGILTVATVAVVCDLLKLPSEAVLVLLIAVDPVMDMIRTASHVHGNVAVTAFVCDLEPQDGQDQRLPA
jgi:proton glutamate symport protein